VKEFEMDSSNFHYPALVLNADFRPLSYFPLSLWSWQDTVHSVFLDRVNVVSEYDEFVHSPSLEMRIPSVISLKEYAKPAPHVAFTRFNVFLRDEFSCQYCAVTLPAHDLTFDHVIPRMLGGRTHWENIVASCRPCNEQKGSMTLKRAGMHLRRPPHRPTTLELQKNGRLFPPNHLHESWRDFLYWDSELED
jgi:5-methylcytosine-specific restriction endonuclease McrA